MKHRFSYIYELDTTVACAVAAYLDAEHYVFLHRKYSPVYEVLRHEGRKVWIRQKWTFAGVDVAQYCTTEYVPPARFLNYDIYSSPKWMPSIHHLVKTRTDLRYYPDATGEKTVSHLEVELDLPVWLWPLRTLLQKKICQLKWAKDLEDIEMVQRRARIFGRGNIKAYLREGQFMLHKDDFVEHFGSGGRSTASPA
jgi:hypothetical protein